MDKFCSFPDILQSLPFSQVDAKLSIPVDWKFTHMPSQVEELTSSPSFKDHPMQLSSIKRRNRQTTKTQGRVS